MILRAANDSAPLGRKYGPRCYDPPRWRDEVIVVSTAQMPPDAARRRPSAVVVNTYLCQFWRGPMYVRLSPTRFRFAAAVVCARRPISVDELIETMWGDDIDGGPLTPEKYLDVTLNHIRPVLRQIGISVEIPRYGLREAVPLRAA